MPNPATIDVPEYEEVLRECDFWLSLGDSQIKVIKSMPLGPNGEDVPVIEGFGSSTLIDSDKDVFHKSAVLALRDRARPRMGTYRNHSFRVPEDNVGNIADTFKADGTYEDRGLQVTTELRDKERAAEIVRTYGDGVPFNTIDADFALLAIRSTVNVKIAEACKTLAAIEGGSEFGWSVGAKYLNAKRRTDGRGVIKGFDVFDAAPKEFSVVSLPSNPLAWVDIARKSAVYKGIIPPSEQDPEYAYVFRNWPDFDVQKSSELDGNELEMVAVAKLLRDIGDIAREHLGLTWAIDPSQRRAF